jgi:hypothetical protein
VAEFCLGNGKTKTGAAAFYSYSNGTASWWWSDAVPFGFAAGGNMLITMNHN